MIDDFDRANAQIDALERILTSMDRLEPDCDVSEVVRVVLGDVIEKLHAESAGHAVSEFVRQQVQCSTDPMNPASALNVVGELSSRLP